jgi:hypothetical protein
MKRNDQVRWKVITFLLLVFVLGIFPVEGEAQIFVHPGLLNNQAELNFIRDQVNNDNQPWKRGTDTNTIMVTISSILSSRSGNSNLLFVGDFASGSLAGERLGCSGCCGSCPWAGQKTCPTVVSTDGQVSPRAGSYMMKTILNPVTSPCPYRAEAKVRKGNGDPFEFKIGQEYWLGISIYIPSDQPHLKGEFLQWHKWRGGSYPNLHLRILDGQWLVKTHWSSNPSIEYEGHESWWLGPPEKDKWTDWVFHVRFSYEKGGDGFIKVYKDGQKVVDYQGPNYYAGQDHGPFVKFGLYEGAWKDQRNIGDQVVYHDELRIGGAGASYEDVVPGGGTPPQIFLPFVSKNSLP